MIAINAEILELFGLAARWNEDEAGELAVVDDGLTVRNSVALMQAGSALERHLRQSLEEGGHPTLKLPDVHEQLRPRRNSGRRFLKGGLSEIAHAACNQGPAWTGTTRRELVDVDVQGQKVDGHRVCHAAHRTQESLVMSLTRYPKIVPSEHLKHPRRVTQRLPLR